MNEQNESENNAPPMLSTPASELSSSTPRPLSYWVRRLLVCNPFYLVSAALLLFGMYRLSVDRNFLAGEVAQLVFNLGSLEFYEILLVATAIFLVARRIWYDSTLLVGLENLFVFVPFILLSQVALIDKHVVWVVSVVTALMAVTRFTALKRYFGGLNLPNRLLVVGFILLVVNIGLLATYRILGETKLGFMPDSGRYFLINQLTWLIILPAALALTYFLPYAREKGSLTHQRRWLPDGFCALWMLATGIHLYCLNYIYNFAFRIEMLAPALWVLAWMAWRRLPDILDWHGETAKCAMAALPVVVTFCAASATGNNIFFVLSFLNVVLFAVMCSNPSRRQFAQHLLVASVVLLVCGMPSPWIHFISPELQRTNLIVLGVAVYLMLYIAMSQNPKAGILGSIMVALATVVLFGGHESAFHWAVQCGLVFLLLHSLRWIDLEHEGAAIVRNLTAVLWVTHSVFWTTSGIPLWLPAIPGGIVLASCLITQILRGRQDLLLLPAASILTVLSGPGNFIVGKLETAPRGLLAVIGSFLLFGLGTVVALAKHHWHHREEKSA